MYTTEKYSTNLIFRDDTLTETGNYFPFAICFAKLDTSLMGVLGNNLNFNIIVNINENIGRGSGLPPTFSKTGRILFTLKKNNSIVQIERFSTTFTNQEYYQSTDSSKTNPYKFSVFEKEGVYYFCYQTKKKNGNTLLYCEIENYQSAMIPRLLSVYDSYSNHIDYNVDLLPEQYITLNNDYRLISYNNYAGEQLFITEIDSYGKLPEKGIGYILGANNQNKLIVRIQDEYYLIPMIYLGNNINNTPANTVQSGNIPNLDVNSVGFSAFHRSNGRPVWWNGTNYKEANGVDVGQNGSGSFPVTTNAILTSATGSYDKWGKHISLSGSFTFETANTNVSINIPFAPDYGCVINVGNLTFTLNSNSTSATVQSSQTGSQGFQLNYKTA